MYGDGTHRIRYVATGDVAELARHRPPEEALLHVEDRSDHVLLRVGAQAPLSWVGRYAAELQAMGLLNLRSANRAVQGSEPGPEGAMTKLVLSEIGENEIEAPRQAMSA